MPSRPQSGKFEFDVEVSLGTRPPVPGLGVSASARRPASQRSHAGHDAPGGTGCARPACRIPPLPGELLASWIAALRAAQFSRAKRPFSGANSGRNWQGWAALIRNFRSKTERDIKRGHRVHTISKGWTLYPPMGNGIP